jgi:hypothetical protein
MGTLYQPAPGGSTVSGTGGETRFRDSSLFQEIVATYGRNGETFFVGLI